MTYPNSSAVSPGQATEADQYNFLRNDALFLGSDPAASGTLRDLLLEQAGPIRLSRASKTLIRLAADDDTPCSVMIGGRICSVRTELTLSLSPEALPNAGRYYVYAVSGSGAEFSLRAGDAAVPNGSRRIGTFLWSGSGIIPGTLHCLREWEILKAGTDPAVCQGRLTLVPGEPASDSEIRLGETLYFTPYNGNHTTLFLGDSWETFEFPELSLNLSGMLREIPYDIFLEADADGLHMCAVSWGTAEARPAGMLTRVDGVRVSGGNNSRRYLGSIALNGAGYGEDSLTGRLVWNENHRLPRPLLAGLVSDRNQGNSHANAWAPYYDEEAPVVRVLIPSADCEFCLEGVGISAPISEADRGYNRATAVGICRDINMVSPYLGNENCADVFTHNFGNSPVSVNVRNRDSSFQGLHSYTLAFWTSYTIGPAGTAFNASCGSRPGLSGFVSG